MSEGQCFGISGDLHRSRLLYGKICADTDNIYKGHNKPYRPNNQKPNRAEEGIKLKKPKLCDGL